MEGLEPPTRGFGDRCSGHLSYTRSLLPLRSVIHKDVEAGRSGDLLELLDLAVDRHAVGQVVDSRFVTSGFVLKRYQLDESLAILVNKITHLLLKSCYLLLFLVEQEPSRFRIELWSSLKPPDFVRTRSSGDQVVLGRVR